MAMSDNFEHSAVDAGGPFTVGAAVTPDDNADLPDVAGALWIGAAGGGALKVDTSRGWTLTFTGVAAGLFTAVRVRRVYSTGTTVTGIIALTG